MAETISPEIREREVKIANRLKGGVTHVGMARSILDVPDNIKGLVIVDIGEGACPLTDYLLRRGADAYAVDRAYDDREKITGEARKWISCAFESAQRVNLPEIKKFREVTISTLNQFLQSFDQHRERYITAWFSELPFPDNFANMTVSLNAISLIDRDLDILKQCTAEAIRITRPGGSVVLAPWKRTEIHRALVEHLRQAAVGEVHQEYNHRFATTRLRIVKFS